MKPHQERALAITRRLPPKAIVAEVGVLVGKLSESILTMRHDAHLIMVDSWAPMSEQPEQYKRTGDTHAFHDQARVDLHKREALRRVSAHSGRTRVLHMASLAAVSEIEDQSLDLVFLDADHSYQGVLNDIRAWSPKVKPGGYIGGHDYLNDNAGFKFGVTQAVDEFYPVVETDLNFTWFKRL